MSESTEVSLTPDQREVLSDFVLASGSIESEFQRLSDSSFVSPADGVGERLESLCRMLETLKENLVFCGMVEISRFLNHIVLACQAMHAGGFLHDPEIREALLQGYDHAVRYAKGLLANVHDNARLPHLPLDPLMRRLSSAHSPTQVAEVVADVFSHVAGAFEFAVLPPRFSEPLRFEQVDLDDYLSAAESRHIASLVAAQEQRNPFWQGRIQVQLNVALAVNRALPEPCDPRQLALAVCLHDLGMMFLPDSILLKNSRLDPDESAQIRRHVGYSCNLLDFSGDAAGVVQMIAQHHEHYDGTGYPIGLAGDALCVGGQLIGLADAYFAMTHQRPDRAFRRSAFRALVEMNHVVGKQFSPAIINAFNSIVRNELGAALIEGAAAEADESLNVPE